MMTHGNCVRLVILGGKYMEAGPQKHLLKNFGVELCLGFNRLI